MSALFMRKKPSLLPSSYQERRAVVFEPDEGTAAPTACCQKRKQKGDSGRDRHRNRGRQKGGRRGQTWQRPKSRKPTEHPKAKGLPQERRPTKKMHLFFEEGKKPDSAKQARKVYILNEPPWLPTPVMAR